jgi:hypothetical protein
MRFLDLGERRPLPLGGGTGMIGLAFLGAGAQQDVERGVAAIVEDHVRAAVGEVEDAVGVVPVFLQRLALDREDRNARLGDRRRGVVLGREDVAGRPADIGAQRASVSIRTAVWIVMCSEPTMRAPFSGLVAPYSSRSAIRPGISVSAMSSSLRPNSASSIS